MKSKRSSQEICADNPISDGRDGIKERIEYGIVSRSPNIMLFQFPGQRQSSIQAYEAMPFPLFALALALSEVCHLYQDVFM